MINLACVRFLPTFPASYHYMTRWTRVSIPPTPSCSLWRITIYLLTTNYIIIIIVYHMCLILYCKLHWTSRPWPTLFTMPSTRSRNKRIHSVFYSYPTSPSTHPYRQPLYQPQPHSLNLTQSHRKKLNPRSLSLPHSLFSTDRSSLIKRLHLRQKYSQVFLNIL